MARLQGKSHHHRAPGDETRQAPAETGETSGPAGAGGESTGASGVDDSPADAASLSPRLCSTDLAPTQFEGRRWRGYDIFTPWANDVHSLGSRTFAIGLFALGLGAWQILLALGIGAVLLFGLLNLSGSVGYETGVPFPVMSRVSFGVRGAQIPALLRGVVGVAWSSDNASPVVRCGTRSSPEPSCGARSTALSCRTSATSPARPTARSPSPRAISGGCRSTSGSSPIITVTLAGAHFRINGTFIKSPTDVVQAIPNTLLLVLTIAVPVVR